MRDYFSYISLLFIGVLLCFTVACAHQKEPKTYPNETFKANETLRLQLSKMTLALGEALPPPAPTDELGVESMPGLNQRVFAVNNPMMADAKTKIRFTGLHRFASAKSELGAYQQSY